MTKPAIIKQRGFTLAEAVIVIVITGIIGAVVAMFIRLPVQGYVDAVARAELTDVADTALRRITRDVRLALPNSIRVSTDAAGNQYLELLLTKTGGRYLAEEDGVAGNFLKFGTTANCGSAPTDCQFDVVGPMPIPQVAVTDSIVVYNLGLPPADAYDCTGQCNRAAVTNVDNAARTITLASNPFAAQDPPMASPTRRFQVVTGPVTYLCRNGAGGTGTLTRYWNYTISATQPTSTASLQSGANAQSALLANNVVSCNFEYDQLANIHSGLVGLTITLTIPNSNSGTVVLFHQVHVNNTP